jgi:hypothetical protein
MAPPVKTVSIAGNPGDKFRPTWVFVVDDTGVAWRLRLDRRTDPTTNDWERLPDVPVEP